MATRPDSSIDRVGVARAAERRRIGHVIHDGPLQSLGAARLALTGAASGALTDEARREAAEKALAWVDEAVLELRRLIP